MSNMNGVILIDRKYFYNDPYLEPIMILKSY